MRKYVPGIRRTLSLALCAFVAYLSMRTWIGEMVAFGPLLIGRSGRSTYRYFTWLSNIFQGLVCCAYAPAQLVCVIRRRTMPRLLVILQYTGTVCVSLTFLTVLVFLGPVLGDLHGALFNGSNRYYHFWVPVLSAVNFMLLDREGVISLKDTLFPMGAVLAYAVYYAVNIIINGVQGNDLYGLLNYGARFAPVVFALFLTVTWLIAALFRLPRRRLLTQNLHDR